MADRGQLRVYLGAAPGLGKTYAVLGEARRWAGRAPTWWSATWRPMAGRSPPRYWRGWRLCPVGRSLVPGNLARSFQFAGRATAVPTTAPDKLVAARREVWSAPIRWAERARSAACAV